MCITRSTGRSRACRSYRQSTWDGDGWFGEVLWSAGSVRMNGTRYSQEVTKRVEPDNRPEFLLAFAKVLSVNTRPVRGAEGHAYGEHMNDLLLYESEGWAVISTSVRTSLTVRRCVRRRAWMETRGSCPSSSALPDSHLARHGQRMRRRTPLCGCSVCGQEHLARNQVAGCRKVWSMHSDSPNLLPPGGISCSGFSPVCREAME
jgi:hypothetical protein